MPKLPDEDDGHSAWPFLQFFKRRKQEKFEMLTKRHPEVEPQVEEYQRITWSQRRRLLAEYWEKQRRDAASAMNYARNEGREEGLEKGLEKGRHQILELMRQGYTTEQIEAKLREDFRDRG